MAREGLRILVVAKKALTREQYKDFEVRAVTWDEQSVGQVNICVCLIDFSLDINKQS